MTLDGEHGHQTNVQPTTTKTTRKTTMTITMRMAMAQRRSYRVIQRRVAAAAAMERVVMRRHAGHLPRDRPEGQKMTSTAGRDDVYDQSSSSSSTSDQDSGANISVQGKNVTTPASPEVRPTCSAVTLAGGTAAAAAA